MGLCSENVTATDHLMVHTFKLLNTVACTLPSFKIQETHQEMRYPNVTQVAIPLLCLTPQTDGFPWDDLRKILRGGQRMAKLQNGEEILWKVSTP